MKNSFNLITNLNSKNDLVVNDSDEIVYDTALINCINELNSLRENDRAINSRTEQDVLESINQISAEMRWFSQWLSVKSNSAA